METEVRIYFESLFVVLMFRFQTHRLLPTRNPIVTDIRAWAVYGKEFKKHHTRRKIIK